MDYAFAGAILAVVLFLFGVITGLGAAKELGKTIQTKKDFVLAVIKVLATGAVLTCVVGFFQLTLAYALILGAMAGALTSLRLDFKDSVGPWKWSEKHFGKEQLKRSGKKTK